MFSIELFVHSVYRTFCFVVHVIFVRGLFFVVVLWHTCLECSVFFWSLMDGNSSSFEVKKLWVVSGHKFNVCCVSMLLAPSTKFMQSKMLPCLCCTYLLLCMQSLRKSTWYTMITRVLSCGLAVTWQDIFFAHCTTQSILLLSWILLPVCVCFQLI